MQPTPLYGGSFQRGAVQVFCKHTLKDRFSTDASLMTKLVRPEDR